MKLPTHPIQAFRLLRHALGLLLALSAAACGPGVGGTGTGSEPPPQAPQAVGFRPASLCSSTLASVLDCNPAALEPGVATAVHFSNGRTSATVQGGRIELAAPCQQLTFTGEWGTRGATGSEEQAFFGQVQSPAASGAAQLRADVAGGALVVRVLGPQDQLLLGPVELPRQAALPSVAGC